MMIIMAFPVLVEGINSIDVGRVGAILADVGENFLGVIIEGVIINDGSPLLNVMLHNADGHGAVGMTGQCK